MEAAETSRARKDGAAVLGAKAWFFATGFAVNAALPVVVGQAQYGLFRRAIGVGNVASGLIVGATVQAVSRRLAATPEIDRATTLRSLVALHANVGVACAVVMLCSAPLLAVQQHTPALAPLIASLSIVSIAYSVYSARVGALNGAGRFLAQAALDATSSTLRSIAIFTGAVVVPIVAQGRLADGAAAGACLGASIAAVTMAAIARATSPWSTRIPRMKSPALAHLRPFVAAAIVYGAIALAMQIDLFAVGRAFAERDDRWSGLYAQTQTLAMLAFQLPSAVQTMALPAISAAHASDESSAMRFAIERALHGTIVVAGFVAVAFAAAPQSALRFVYGARVGHDLDVALAAPVLAALSIAHVGSAIVGVVATALFAAHRARAAIVTAGVFVASIALTTTVAAIAPATDPAARATHFAVATLFGAVAAAASSLVAIHLATSARLRARDLLRALSVAVVAGFVARLLPMPTSRLAALVPCVVAAFVYLAGLLATGDAVVAGIAGFAGASRR